MKNSLLNTRKFKALTMGFLCMSGLITALPMATAIAAPAFMMPVIATPIITSFTPTAAVGTVIEINGDNLNGTTQVKFGNLVTTTGITIKNDKKITVIVPANAAIGTLTVETAGGTATTTTAFTPYVTWNGTVDNNWDNPFNWGNNQVPGATTNVVLNATSRNPIVNSAAMCNNLTIQGSVTLTLNPNADLTVSGLFANNGNYTQTDGLLTLTGSFSNLGGFSHTGGTINFAAPSGNQNLPALTYHNLTISGAGNKILQGDATVKGNLNFTGSNLKMAATSDILTLEGNVSGEDTNQSFIGKLVKTQTVSAAIPYDAFGNIGVLFTNTGGGNWGAVTATRVTGEAIVTPKGKSISRYWTITPANPATNTAVNLTLTWLSSELNGLAFANGQAQAWRQELGNPDWIPVDNMQNIASNGNQRSITVTTNNFSKWAISDQMNPLPVSMTSFTGRSTVAGPLLNWETASEKNAATFEVERSVNGKEFETIGSVKAGGNSNLTLKYAFTDRNATNKVNYYRLRMVDLDGTFEYSSIVTITSNAKASDLNVVAYPNPFSESLNLKVSTAVSKAEVVLMTVDGKQIYRQSINEASPVTNLALTNLPKMKPGFYLLNLIVDGKATVLKVAQQ